MLTFFVVAYTVHRLVDAITHSGSAFRISSCLSLISSTAVPLVDGQLKPVLCLRVPRLL